MERQYTVNTGEQSEIYSMIDDFFDALQRKIDERYDNLLAQNPNLRLHPLFERRVYGVRPLEFRPEDHQKPDDVIHMLLYHDRVVAVVTEQRTNLNYVQFSFFDNLESVLGNDK
jgi:hypothetical protein